jgi:DNA-binding transcriptional ArsR family regulator
MSESAADILLHPVRLRIVRALTPQRTATVRDLAAELSDVPPATLYRHVRKLESAGLITAVSQRRMRGAQEASYALTRAALDSARPSAADHLRYFITFTATLIDDFAAYVESGEPDYARDGVSYRQGLLHLSDAELRRMSRAVAAAILPFTALAPSAKRTPRLLATILLPAKPRRTFVR